MGVYEIERLLPKSLFGRGEEGREFTMGEGELFESEGVGSWGDGRRVGPTGEKKESEGGERACELERERENGNYDDERIFT